MGCISERSSWLPALPGARMCTGSCGSVSRPRTWTETGSCQPRSSTRWSPWPPPTSRGASISSHRSELWINYLTAVAESGSRTPTPPRRTELQYSPPSTRMATARCRRTSGSCSAARRSSPGSNEEEYIPLESQRIIMILMFKQPNNNLYSQHLLFYCF